MKRFTKKHIISLILIIAMLFNFTPFGTLLSYALNEGYSANIEEDNIDLGTTKPGYDNSNFTDYFTVHNTGTQNFYLQNSKIELSGNNADSFITGQNQNGVFSAGQTKTNNYFIKPISGLSAGTYTATATLYLSDDFGETFEEVDTCNISFTVSDHNFSNEWSTNTQYHWHSCLDDNCQEKSSFGNHDNNVIKNATEPTFDTDGYTGDQYCSICDYKIADGNPIAAGKYIRESRAIMTPSTLTAGTTPSNYTITSAEPTKYTTTVGNWWDLTSNQQITSSTELIKDHQYRITVNFDSVGNYLYNQTSSEYGSTFFINDQIIGTTMSVAFSTYRTFDTNCTDGSGPEIKTVIFNNNTGNGGADLSERNIPSGSTVTKPNPDPVWPGHIFDTWCVDSTLTTPFNFSTPITDDIMLYARWNDDPNAFNPGNYADIEIGGEILEMTEADGNDATVTLIYNDNNTVVVTGTNLYSEKTQENRYFIYALGDVTIEAIPAENYDADLRENGNLLGTTTKTYTGLTVGNHHRIDGEFIPSGGGNQQQQNYQDIVFNISWTNTFINTWINNHSVMEESQDYGQPTYTYNGINVEDAGNTDPNQTNELRFQQRFGDLEVKEYTINGEVYDENNPNVAILEDGWHITVPGASNYTISGTGDENSIVPRTIIWVNPDYVPENEENAQWVSGFTVEHGIARVVEVYDENDNLLNPNTYIGENADQYGLNNGFGWVSVLPGYRVIFEFVPEYGYQLTGIAINETPLEAINDINRFEVEIPQGSGNLHFAATFTPTEDTVLANSTKVNSGSISLNNILDGGSAQLTVNDVELSADKINGFENAAGQYTISNYLDIDLYNVFYKGKNDANDVWSNKIDELTNDATITIKLEDGIDAADIVIVHNIHDGDQYEIIQIDSYDPTTNTITFKTKSFSNFAIASKSTYTLTIDLNGGIPGSQYENPVQIEKGTYINASEPPEEFVTPKNGYVYAGLEVNGIKYYKNNYALIPINEDSTVKFLWNKIINEVNLTLNLPTVGDTTSMEKEGEYWNWDAINNPPSVVAETGANYVIDATYWIMGWTGEEYDTPFVGTFESGKEYKAEIAMSTNEGYQFANNVVVKVNGKQIDQTIYHEIFLYSGIDSMSVGKIITPKEKESNYNIVDGPNQTINTEENGDLSVTCDGDISKFVCLKVDDTELDAANFTILSGSTKATLKNSYLNTLSEGTHKLTFVYTDGEASTNFTIAKSNNSTPQEDNSTTNQSTNTTKDTKDIATSKSPKTGDNITIWISLMLISSLGILATYKYLKKRN